MKPLTAAQLALYERTPLNLVTLVELTTFSDRTLETVSNTRYFSESYRLYDWGGGGVQQFDAWLESIDVIRADMPHLPAADSAFESSIRHVRNLRLRNAELDDGSRLWPTLRDDNVLFARVAMAQLALEEPTPGAWRDLRGLPGTEHVFWTRGEVTAVRGVTDIGIELEVTTEHPELPWLIADQAAINDPRDLGKRLPIVLGQAKRVEAIGWRVGWVTTTAEAVSSGASTIQLTDATGLPTSGSVRAAKQTWSYTGITGNQLTGVTGVTGDVPAGTVAIERLSTDIDFVVSSIGANAIGDVFVLSPFTGELTRVTTAFTKTPANTTLISGETVAVVTFTQAQLESLLDALAADVAVTQQPSITTQPNFADHTVNGSTGGNATATIAPALPSNARDGNPGSSAGLTSGTTYSLGRPSIPAGASATRVTLRVQVKNWSGTVGATDIVIQNQTLGEVGRINRPDVGNFSFEMAPAFLSQLFISGPGTAEVSGAFFEIEYTEPVAHSINQNTVVSTIAVQSAAVGFGLRLFADVDGPAAPDTNYSVAQGTLLTKAPDLIRYVLAVLAGLGHTAVDATSFSAAITNLGSNTYGMDLRVMGPSFAQVLARMAFEARASLFPVERDAGAVWKLLTADSLYSWGSSTKTLEAWVLLEEQSRTVLDVVTRFDFLYAFDASASGRDEEAFRSAEVAIDSTVEQKFGRRDGLPDAFLAIQDATTAAEIAGYYQQERARVAATWRMAGVPWVDGYAIELGDVVAFTPPWDTAAKTARVLSTVKDPATEFVDLVLQEVI